MSDDRLRQQVKERLASDAEVAAQSLSLDVKDGVVYLSGKTATRDEQARAIDMLRSLRGVQRIENAMWVDDTALTNRVRQALASEPLLASVPFDIDSHDGMVRLMSDDTTRDQRERAMQIARAVEGVTQVEDRMK